MPTLTLHLTTDVGARVSLEVDEAELMDTLRRYGQRGWVSGEIPAAGLVLPFDNEADFDWALLGGTKGERGVRCRGYDWARLEHPPAILYARRAKASDPTTLRQVFEDDEYVVLVRFEGGARQDAYALPGATTPATPPEPPAETQPSGPSKEPQPPSAQVAKMWDNMRKLLDELEAHGLSNQADDIMRDMGYQQGVTEDVTLGRSVYKALRALT